MEQLKKAIAWFWTTVEVMMAVGMSVMIVIVFINVVLRYGFDSGLLATAEVSRFLFVWIIMLGAVTCLRDDAHLDLRVIERKLPSKLRWLLRRMVNGVILLSSYMLFLGSYRQTIANWPNISPMSGLPVGVMYLAGAVAGSVMALIACYRFFVSRHDFQSTEEQDE